MMFKWIGAVLVVAGCGGWGMLLSSGYRRQEAMLRKLSNVLRTMRRDLRYRLTAIPDLMRHAAADCTGTLRNVFREAAEALDAKSQPDAAGCMRAVLQRYDTLPPKPARLLRQLGKTLGRFDLEGQLQGLSCVISECDQELQDLKKDREIRLRSYRTLALCAGVALVILFI